MRMTICVDFDGVLSQYSGWKDGKLPAPGDPIPGALEACRTLARRYDLAVLTSRHDHDVLANWLRQHGFPEMPVTDRKLPALAYVDDRAVRFDGSWERALEAVGQKPWWKG